MKIDLIGPVWGSGRRTLKSKIFPIPSLTLPTVAALTPEEHDVSIHDISEFARNGELINMERLYGSDIIGVSVIAQYADVSYRLTEDCKRNGVHTVHGGIHVSVLPEASNADTVFVGEVENTWKIFLDEFKTGRQRRFYIDRGPKKGEMSTPVPRRDLIPKRGVSKIWDYMATVEYSRGCPYNCGYCCTPIMRKGYSVRPLDEFVSELEGLDQKYILFADNNIVGSPEKAKNMLRAISPLKKKWVGGLPPDSVIKDKELLPLLKESGCIGLFFGFESLSDENVRKFNNPQKKRENYETCVKMVKDAGISPETAFIFGFDYDGPSAFDNVLEFVTRNKVPLVSANIATPIPGTGFYKEMEEEGRLLHTDYSLYDFDHVVHVPRLVSPEQLQEGYNGFLREIYSFGNIFKRIGEVDSMRNYPWTAAVNLSLHIFADGRNHLE